MITGVAKLVKPLSLAFTLLFMVSACGGGGGGGGFLPDDGNDGPVLDISLSLTDSAGNPTSTISASSRGTLTVTVTSAPGPGAEGEPVVDEVVTVQTGLATIEPDSGTRLTNQNGVAVFDILAGPGLGADDIQVSVEGPDGPVTETINYEVVAGNTLELTLLDPDGNPTSLVTATRPGTLIATVMTAGANPQPVEDGIVRVSTDIGVIVPDSGSALTDADGEASFEIRADDNFGAGTLTVTYEGAAGDITETLNIQIARADLRLGHFQNGSFVPGEIGTTSTSLSAGGSALLTIAIVDQNLERAVGIEEELFLSSPCAIDGKAELPASVVTTTGLVQATYRATACSGEDTITASLDGIPSEASVTLDIASPRSNSIDFVSVEPNLIALRATGGIGGPNRPETSTVTFKVVAGTASGETGTPLAGYEVNFELSSNIGGAFLDRTSTVTDTEGLARVVVQSGDVATNVRVVASIETEDDSGNITFLENVSDAIAISTMLPDQNSFSISASRLSVLGGREFDGRTSEITARLADKFNNPVPDGTAVTFTTEYGSIPSSCFTVDGVCSVTWTSQAPRFPTFNRDLIMRNTNFATYDCPAHSGNTGPCPNDLGPIRGLRTTILATAVGEEYFVDSNGNGVYNEGEPFENLPEAFIDNNEDLVYTPVMGPQCGSRYDTNRCIAAGAEETFVDFNNNGSYDLNVDPNTGEGLYSGVLCPPAGDGIWCDRELLFVRDSIVLVLSSEGGFYFDILLTENRTGINTVVNGTFEGRSYIAYIADEYNNPPAGGTTVTLSGEDGCEIVGDTTFEVPDTNRPGAIGVPFRTTGNGTVTITLNSGGGYSESFYCEAPEDIDCDVSPLPPGCP